MLDRHLAEEEVDFVLEVERTDVVWLVEHLRVELVSPQSHAAVRRLRLSRLTCQHDRIQTLSVHGCCRVQATVWITT